MSDPSTTRLSDDLQSSVARAFGFDDPPVTFEAFWMKMLQTFAEGLDRELTLADLCTTEQSPHWATVDGETQHYQCVTDGFILGTVLDDPVTVRTESPVTATELIVEFDADSVASVPDDALLSFGVERSVPRPDEPVTPEQMYGRFCPYSNVFTSRAEYDQWASNHPDVVSDVHPLDAALALQARLLDDTAAGGSADRSQNRAAPECTCCDGGEF